MKHGPAARELQRKPVDQIEVGDRQEQKEQVVEEKTRTALAARQPDEKVGEKDDADGELYPQIGLGKVAVVSGENFHGHGQQQQGTGRQRDDIQRKIPNERGLQLIHNRLKFTIGRTKSMPQPLLRFFLRKKALKTFARIKISITFALAFKAMAR